MNQDPIIESTRGKGFRLRCAQEISYPIDEVFAFFSRPENLAKLTPPSMGFQLLTPRPIDMTAGLDLEYRIRPLGFPMRWISRIRTWNPPHSFTDIQLKGPFRSWEHIHRFVSTDTGTRIEDDVHYRVPGGRLADKWFVRGQLLGQFRYRTIRMRELFP
jgi:ligand-binding SRPBCC domain-containing protein